MRIDQDSLASLAGLHDREGSRVGWGQMTHS